MKPSETHFPIGRLGRVGVLAMTLCLTLLAVLPLRAQRVVDAAQSAGNQRAGMSGAAEKGLAARHAGESARLEQHEKPPASDGKLEPLGFSGSTAGTSHDGSVASPIGTTYSVHHSVGEDVEGQVICSSIAADPPPGAVDDTVVFDGLAEAIRTDIHGTIPMVRESKTDNGDGTHLIEIDTESFDNSPLFPGGIPCFSIGRAAPPFGDPLDWPGMDTVTSAQISYLNDGIVVNGPFDITATLTDPWDGYLVHTLVEEPPVPGINGVHVEILVEKTPQGPLGACCVGGECLGDFEEVSCQFQGGHWMEGASCGAEPTLPLPICDQTPCSFNNGLWLDDGGAPRSQYAPDAHWAVAAADDFILRDTGANSCWINQIRAWVSHELAEVHPSVHYRGVNVTVYADGASKGPNGNPENNGAHTAFVLGGIVSTQTIPISSMAASPQVSSCLANVWQLDIPVNLILNKNTKYWLEIQPIMDAEHGDVFWLLSENNNDHPAQEIATRLGIPSWAEISGNEDACPSGQPPTPAAETRTNLAFRLIGEKVPRPLNDRCADAIPVSNGIVPINNIGASTDGPDETGRCDPDSGYTEIDADIWYEYVADRSGNLTVSLCGSDFDTKLAVYEGCARCPPLVGSSIACNDDSPSCDLSSEVTFHVTEGICYQIRIGGFRGADGKGIMTITPPPPIVGACCDRAIGDCGDNVTEDQCDGAQDEWTPGAPCAALDPPCVPPPPPHDECEDCMPIFTGEPYSGSTESATGTDTLCCPTCFADNIDVWHCWTADCTGAAIISLCDSEIGFDTTLAVYDGCGDDANLLACNDDRTDQCSYSLHSEISPEFVESEEIILPVTAGETYYIRVAGYFSAVGDYALEVESCANACCTVDGFCGMRQQEVCEGTGSRSLGAGSFCLGDSDDNGADDACQFVLDYDQNKDYDNADGDADPSTGVDPFYCGPTACANSLAWLHQQLPDAGLVPPESTKSDVIEELATLMGTNGTPGHDSPNGHPTPYVGTFVDDLEAGVHAYLAGHHLTNVFKVRTEMAPSFESVATAMRPDESVLLLLGFYHVNDVSAIGDPITGYVVDWRRTGGHFTTVASIDLAASQLAVSDPDADAAEHGGPGTVWGLDLDHDHDGDGDPSTTLEFRDPGYDHTRHNDRELASHDLYDARSASDPGPPESSVPGGEWVLGAGDDVLAYGDAMAPFHSEDAGGAFDVPAPTFLSVEFLQQAGFPVPVPSQTYTVIEAAVLISVAGDRACCLTNGFCEVMAPLTCREQGGVPLGEGVGCAGDNDESGVDDACSGCLDVSFTEVFPPDGTIDARQPHTPGDAQTREGIGDAAAPIVIALSPPVDGAEECFVLCETQHHLTLGPNMVSSVNHRGSGEYEIALHHAITPGAVTIIEYTGTGLYATYVHHPGNVDGDTEADEADVQAFLDCCLGGSCEPHSEIYSCDLDRSGRVAPADLLREIDILMGAEEFASWLGSQRPENTVCPADD